MMTPSLARTTAAVCIVCACVASSHGREPNENEFDVSNVLKTISVLSTSTTLEFLDHPLLDVITALERRNGVTFRIDVKNAADKTVTIDTQEQPLGRSLQIILGECGYEYSIGPDGTILIAQKTNKG